MTAASRPPAWQQEIESFAGVKPLFVIEGNVRDLYPQPSAPTRDAAFPSAFDQAQESAEATFDTLPATLAELFGAPYRFLFANPLEGFTNPLADPHANELLRRAAHALEAGQARSSELNFSLRPEPFADNRMVHDSAVVRAALTLPLGGAHGLPPNSPERPEGEAEDSADAPAPDAPVVCVVDLASRLTADPANLTAEENATFLNLYLAAEQALRPDGRRLNTLVLLVNAARDLPPWLFSGNAQARVITIPLPDRPARRLFIDSAFPPFDGPEGLRAREHLIDATDGMRVTELDEVRRLYLRDGTNPATLGAIVDTCKYGIRENPWSQMVEKLRDNPKGRLERRVKGQDAALERIIAVLKRSVLGFSGMQHSSGAKPKGVLFLAGPTGTGKTETVKAVTELLFGDERSCLRFDMSEYAAENADQKLFGAPPGYVGYEAGGQLTNAVRANPFSVLLFDEIEKAHPSIMDKFLQILEDGRMTDGQGATVRFSETLIFFTSNAGVSETVLDNFGNVVERRAMVQPGDSHEVLERKIREGLRRRFKPEVLGRIGENVIVFDYMSEEASGLIVDGQLARIRKNVELSCGITVEVHESAASWLKRRSLSPDVRALGGRGIGNLVESAFLNPLATFVFDGTGDESGGEADGEPAPATQADTTRHPDAAPDGEHAPATQADDAPETAHAASRPAPRRVVATAAEDASNLSFTWDFEA